MATLINNARVEWSGYEFGVEFDDGQVALCQSYDIAKGNIQYLGSKGMRVKLMMRCVYRTDWTEAI